VLVSMCWCEKRIKLVLTGETKIKVCKEH
jgi:hypothetical protein